MIEILGSSLKAAPPPSVETYDPEDSAFWGQWDEELAHTLVEKLEPTQFKKSHVYTHTELKQRCRELGSQNYLIEELLPERSLGVLVGDSGLGKSPLVYQMGLCVASGVPFLGRAVRQGSVLFLDFENGLGQVDGMLDGLCRHLALSQTPDNLFLWNLNDADSDYVAKGYNALNVILETKPTLTIVDSLTGLYPEIENQNSNATKALQELRGVMRKCGTSILSLHHTRKPSTNPEQAPPSLQHCSNVRGWFLQARGPRALINASDIRLGVDLPVWSVRKLPLCLEGSVGLKVKSHSLA